MDNSCWYAAVGTSLVNITKPAKFWDKICIYIEDLWFYPTFFSYLFPYFLFLLAIASALIAYLTDYFFVPITGFYNPIASIMLATMFIFSIIYIMRQANL